MEWLYCQTAQLKDVDRSVALLLLDGFSAGRQACGARGIMNLDDLMEVWRSQDAATLNGVNETLLRLALRQDQAKLQAQRRREEWITHPASRSGINSPGASRSSTTR